MNGLFDFIVKNKMGLYKILSGISFMFIVINPIYSFAIFVTSITLLAYSDVIKDYFDEN